MAKWEYEMSEIGWLKKGNWLRHFNRKGEKGWELVQIHNGVAIFKRKIED